MTESELPEDLLKAVVPADPKPNCKHCYGRGHIGQNKKTGKYKPCPKCYPGAAESELTPLEIIAATKRALQSPEKVDELVEALQQVDEDGGEAADKILGEELEESDG